jgi:GTP-binding protein
MDNKFFFSKTKYIYSFENIDHMDIWAQSNPFDSFKSLCVVGRSNVGKSTFINAFFNYKISRTSKTPGRTQKINVFEFYINNQHTKEELGPYYFFDLPGFGHANVSKAMRKSWDVLMDYFLKNLNNETVILHIQDCRHPFMEHDKIFNEFIKDYDFKNYILFNKFDKLRNQKERSLFTKSLKQIYENKEYNIDKNFAFKISSLKRDNIEPIKKSILTQWSIIPPA